MSVSTGRSVYKTQEGRRAMARWYDHFLARAGRQDVRFEQVQTRYGRTNVLLAGSPDSPPLWCFHGVMANASAGLSQIHALADSMQIIFPDMIGQPGRSDEAYMSWQGEDHGHWALDVMDAMGHQAIDAFGVSLGGYVILRAASLAPERVRRAALWAPGGLIKGHMGDMWSLILAGLAYAIRPTPDRLKRIMDKNFTSVDEDWAGFFADSLRHVHPDRRFPATLREDALRAWRAPVLLLLNEHDRVFPAELLLARAQRVLPNLARVEHLQGFRHGPPVEPGAIDHVLAMIRDFMSQAPAA